MIKEGDGGFYVERGETWYDGKPHGSHNGWSVFEGTAVDIIKAIWENQDWFEPCEITPIKWSRADKSITLSFSKPLPLDEVERFVKGVQRTLNDHYSDTVKKMGWRDELVDVDF